MLKPPTGPADAAAWILSAAAVLSAIALGATEPWVRLALETVMALVACLWMATARPGRWALVMPFLVTAPAAIQLVPLPNDVLEAIAPMPAAISAQAGARAWAPISVDPAATATGLRRLFLAACAVAAVSHFSGKPICRRRLVTGLALTGFVISLAALVTAPFKADRVVLGVVDLQGELEHWRTVVDQPVQTIGVAYRQPVDVSRWRYQADAGVVGLGFGPYITSNQFAGALAMCLPAMMAIWLRHSRDRLPRWLVAAGLVSVVLAAFAIIGPLARSRAGLVAFAASVSAFVALTAGRRWQRILGCAGALLIAASVIVTTVIMVNHIVAIADVVPSALQPVALWLLYDPRATAVQAACRIFSGSFVFGTGLNTYGEMYSRVVPGDVLMLYAHNDYGQWLAETGIAGISVPIGLMAGLMPRLSRFLATTEPPYRLDAAAAWAGLAGIAVHSAFDWNLHLPSNAMLAVVLAGLAGGSGTRHAGGSMPSARASLIERSAHL